MTAPETLTTETWYAAFSVVTDNIIAEAIEWSAALFGLWLAGRLTSAEFPIALTAQLVVSIGGAMVTADVMTAVLTDEPVIGYTVDDRTVTRLQGASRTLTASLDEPGDTRAHIERIAISEPVNALQQTTVDALARHGVTGYRRGTDADPCKLCTWLVKAHLDPAGLGYIYPTGQPMHRHTGCRCVPVPVLTGA